MDEKPPIIIHLDAYIEMPPNGKEDAYYDLLADILKAVEAHGATMFSASKPYIEPVEIYEVKE